jgi:hypothetical protein
MAEANRPEAQIYQLRAVIRGISPMNCRLLLVESNRILGVSTAQRRQVYRQM